VNVSDFDFELPSELIAQEPVPDRSTARLLHMERATGAVTHSAVSAIPTLLTPGDVVVVNNTRVFPARLLGHRAPSGGAVECVLLTRVESGGRRASDPSARREGSDTRLTPPMTPPPADEELWEALVHPGQKLKPGARVILGEGPTLHAEILERRAYGRRLVRLWTDDGSSIEQVIDTIGHVPLPPYIHRGDLPSDRERYQTIFALERGSIAAPTAGLHFTPSIVAALAARGVQIAEITLHVGYGTFQPVRVEVVEEHSLEPEQYEIGPRTADIVNRALDERRRVVAVGTTTTRTLEWAGIQGRGRIHAGRGSTRMFIHPGFEFRIVAGLLTNFHLPKSSLIMLVSAFAGLDHVLAAYHEAIARGYRFYSYGDAMLIT
jgi:S-adenosylmethionine:tRNA ribosyltransferase-isomerase